MKLSIRQSLAAFVVAGFALFTTNALATDVDITLTVDNEYSVYISTDAALPGSFVGEDVGEGADWAVAESYTATLTPGVTNYIHVFAENLGGPAGFLAELTLSDALFEFPNGGQGLLTNTTDGWLVGTAPPVAAAPVFIGDHGDAPWGVITDGVTADPAISPDADWIWLDAGEVQTPVVVFTVAIAPIEVDIDVSVVDTPDPVVAGSGTGNLTHTFTIENVSAEDATGVVVDLLASTIPAEVSIESIKDGADADITFPWAIGDLAAGASVTATITLTVAANAADGDTVSATVGLTAVDQVDGNPENDQAVDPTTIAREFDLGLAVVDAPDPVLAGSGAGNLTHTFTLSRSGPSDAAGVTVELVPTLPAGVALDSAVPTVGSVAGTTWTVGDWAASANGVDQTLTLTLTVDATAVACTDCVSAEGTVSAASGTDTNADNDTAIDPTSIEVASNLTTSFATSIMFSNGAMGTVTATLTCNAGLPLSQSFDISEGSPVTFTMTDLPFLTDGTECEITATGVDGYTVTGSANGGIAAASCMFDSTTFATSAANTCEFTATPDATAVAVETIVMSDDPTIGDSFTTTISCDSVNPDPDDAFGAVTVTDSSGLFEANWYADPDGGTTCTVSTVFADSAIEAEPCEFSFDVGDEAAGCDVAGTVFFEGIPTLSQYGLALMALLMLGVGFVGMRRFV